MKKRNPFAVFILSLITLGIYDIYWLVVTKKELNRKAWVKVPSIWLLFAPLILFFASFFIVFLNSHNAGDSSGGLATGLTVLLDFVFILLIVPVTFYWFFKFSKAVNQYTNGKMNTGVTFLLIWALHQIGVAFVQDAFNDMIDAGEQPASGTPATAPFPPASSTSVPPSGSSSAPPNPHPRATPTPSQPSPPESSAPQPPQTPQPPAPAI